MGSHQRLVLHLMTRGLQRDDSMRGQFKLLLEHAMTRIASAVERGQKVGTVKTQVAPDQIATWLLAAALGLTTMLNFELQVDLDLIQESARELLRIEPR